MALSLLLVTLMRPAADLTIPTPRTDANSKKAHEQLLAKAKSGKIDLYFLGDSITRRWGCTDPAWAKLYENWKSHFFGWNAGNFGWGADGIQNVHWRVANGELDGVNPKVVVIEAGTNNLSTERGAAHQIIEGMSALVETVHAKAPHAKVVVMGIFPRNDNPTLIPVIQEANAGFNDLARTLHFQYLDIWRGLATLRGELKAGMTQPDKLHLDVRGYDVWAKALEPLLLKVLGPRSKTDHAPPATGDPSIH